MAVRIIKDDFWATVETNKALIRRCFLYLLNRFPDHNEEKESVYAGLLTWLCEKNIFNKFDHSRSREGQTEDAAWQHFVFCYIQKFMGDNYNKNIKHALRNSTDNNIDSYHRCSYKTLRKPTVNLFNEETDDTLRKKNGSVKLKSGINSTNLTSVYPTIDDIDSIHSSKRYGFDECIEAHNLAEAIQGQLKNDIERKVFKGCARGLTHKDIAVQVNRTPAAVSAMVKRIKQRCVDNHVLV